MSELAWTAASQFLDEVESARRAGETFTAALSGGRIAADFFSAIAKQSKPRQTCLDHVHFFWADERCVPPEDEQSNFRLAQKHLFGPLGILERSIHRVRGELPPPIAAANAEQELRRVVPVPDHEGLPPLNFIQLGMGEDGHVASLFPGEPEAIRSSPAVYRAVSNSPKPPPDRVTLGYGMIAIAARVMVLVSGAAKQVALDKSLAPSGSTPLARVIQSRAHTVILSSLK